MPCVTGGSDAVPVPDAGGHRACLGSSLQWKGETAGSLGTAMGSE